MLKALCAARLLGENGPLFSSVDQQWGFPYLNIHSISLFAWAVKFNSMWLPHEELTALCCGEQSPAVFSRCSVTAVHKHRDLSRGREEGFKSCCRSWYSVSFFFFGLSFFWRFPVYTLITFFFIFVSVCGDTDECLKMLEVTTGFSYGGCYC